MIVETVCITGKCCFKRNGIIYLSSFLSLDSFHYGGKCTFICSLCYLWLPVSNYECFFLCFRRRGCYWLFKHSEPKKGHFGLLVLILLLFILSISHFITEIFCCLI